MSTQKQYNTTYKLWWQFCVSRKRSPYLSGSTELLEFLQGLLDCKKHSFGTFNTHRAALSLILPGDIGGDKNIRRFMKGISNTRPNKPKYNFTWDVEPLLKYLESMSYPNDHSLKNLSAKCAMLLLLVTGHRIQTISLIKIENIKQSDTDIQIFIPDRVKNSSVTYIQPCLYIPYFRENPAICVASIVKLYLEKTKPLRKDSGKGNFFITTKFPFRAATKQTVSRWIRNVLSDSGIDTSIFQPHSSRHATTSAAYKQGISIDLIRQTAGWSKDSQTFAKFYNRPVVNRGDFAESILGLCSK